MFLGLREAMWLHGMNIHPFPRRGVLAICVGGFVKPEHLWSRAYYFSDPQLTWVLVCSFFFWSWTFLEGGRPFGPLSRAGRIQVTWFCTLNWEVRKHFISLYASLCDMILYNRHYAVFCLHFRKYFIMYFGYILGNWFWVDTMQHIIIFPI